MTSNVFTVPIDKSVCVLWPTGHTNLRSQKHVENQTCLTINDQQAHLGF